MRQLSMSGVTGLDDLRRRPDLSCWLAPRVRSARSLLGGDNLRGEGRAVADPVTVPELAVLPL